MLRDWAIAFATTLVAEIPVYVLALRRSLATRTAFAAALLLNLATHPLAWAVFRFAGVSFPLEFLGVEALVVVVEGVLLFAATRKRGTATRLPFSRCLAISFTANSFSAGLSLLVWT